MRERGPRQDERRDDRGQDGDEPHADEANAVAGASLAASVPLYEYRCPNGHLFEVIHRMTEDGPAACEVCGAAPLQRVLHPVAVHYKGSGFYSTDYGRKSSKTRRRTGRSSDSSSGGSSDSGSDSKSDSSSGERRLEEDRRSLILVYCSGWPIDAPRVELTRGRLRRRLPEEHRERRGVVLARRAGAAAAEVAAEPAMHRARSRRAELHPAELDELARREVGRRAA